MTLSDLELQTRVTMVDFTTTDPAPAGIALLARVIAVATANGVTISGPAAGVRAEASRSDGTLLTTVELVLGSGTAPLAPTGSAPAVARVSILDVTGAVVAEAPVTEAGG